MIYGGDGGWNMMGTFDDLPEVVRKTTTAVRRRVARYDAIVVRGISGVVVGAPVAVAVGLPLVVVRKDDDKNNHRGGKYHKITGPPVIGTVGARCLFLDDFTSTGTTARACADALPDESEIVECYYYQKYLGMIPGFYKMGDMP